MWPPSLSSGLVASTAAPGSRVRARHPGQDASGPSNVTIPTPRLGHQAQQEQQEAMGPRTVVSAHCRDRTVHPGPWTCGVVQPSPGCQVVQVVVLLPLGGRSG